MNTINLDENILFSQPEENSSNPPNPPNPTDPQNHFFDGSPLFADEIYNNLPGILKSVCSPFKGRDRDLSLIGTITVLSACIPNIYGIYDKSKVYPNLYLFVSAPASAGKGVLNYCKNIAVPIHKILYEQNKPFERDYFEKLRQYKKEYKNNPDIQKPPKPGKRMLFIPGNNSASGAFQLLFFNGGKGLIFETEGDTLSNTFKTDYGNYSDGFRKAFQHETISYYRKTDMEHVEIPNPCLSAVLSGTPNQILSLIPNSEDGMLSRFIFYVFSIDPYWKDVFEKTTESSIDEYFLEIGREHLNIYELLLKIPETEFHFTEQQNEYFNKYFKKLQDSFNSLWGSETVAIIRRLGLICFRIAMILSVLRNKGKMSKILMCEDRDFALAADIIEVLHEHSRLAYIFISSKSAEGITLKDRFYNQLPEKFSRQDYLRVAKDLVIPYKTADKYIKQVLKNRIRKVSYNNYEKM
jgi:hypothetical protein